MITITDILKILIIFAVISFTQPLYTGIFNAEYYFFYIILIVALSAVSGYGVARGFVRLTGIEKQDRQKGWLNFIWGVLFILFTAGLYQIDKSFTWSSECATYRILQEGSHYQKMRRSKGWMIYFLHVENETGQEKYHCAKREWDRYERGQSVDLCRRRTLLGFVHLTKQE